MHSRLRMEDKSGQEKEERKKQYTECRNRIVVVAMTQSPWGFSGQRLLSGLRLLRHPPEHGVGIRHPPPPHTHKNTSNLNF